MRAFPVCKVADRHYHVAHGGIEHLMGAELLGEFAALGRDVEGNDTRAHDNRELRRRQTHRTLTEDGDCLAAL